STGSASGPVTVREDPAMPADQRPLDPSAALDPKKRKGNDCKNEGNPGTVGGTLHCGP
ncbi:MAG: hypothetical protein QOG16_1719, partial [Actinomycetota bacterium]|nr:hypothetical protein [Actinomycetota bacterium]